MLFQSTPSGGKATRAGRIRRNTTGVSIHAFRGEGDPIASASTPTNGLFQSTPSGGKATSRTSRRAPERTTESAGARPEPRPRRVIRNISFNPRLPGGRRLNRQRRSAGQRSVSIHAFRGEGDLDRVYAALRAERVSIHAFRGEGDTSAHLADIARQIVSIHAFRGEGDTTDTLIRTGTKRFNPRLPGGRRRCGCADQGVRTVVSIHAFRGEGDRIRSRGVCDRITCFNPRLPGGRRPERRKLTIRRDERFNPRLPGGRRRASTGAIAHRPSCFNPRLPGGRRPTNDDTTNPPGQFQSTPSGGKATRTRNLYPSKPGVSIHAFRGEGDSTTQRVCGSTATFQSTPSGGKATINYNARHNTLYSFNPRLPGGRRLLMQCGY